jgi:hypothetical protein
MKKLRDLIAVLAVMGMAVTFTGCGDDDNGDDNGNPNPQTFAPADLAALTAQNLVYTVTIAGQDPIELRFPSAGNYEIRQSGVTETGTFTATKSGERWTIDVTPAAGQAGAQAGVLQLDWTGANAGTWTFTPTGGAAETGTFTVTDTGGGGNNGGTPGGGTPGGTTAGGGLPDSLDGRSLQINYAGGGGEKFDFSGASTVSYENGTHSGTYAYDKANRRVDVTLANGWLYQITLTDDTNASVFFRQNAGDAGNTDAATYTLTP